MSELRRQAMPPFRRRLFAAPRRRVRPVLRVLAAMLRVGAVLVPIGALAMWVLVSPAFALRTLEVAGNRRVASEWIEVTLRSELGQNLLRLDLARIHDRLRGHPWIRSVALHKRLPHHLRVEVVEHKAAALLQVADGLVYLSDEGELITPYVGGVEEAPSYLVIGYGRPILEKREENRAGRPPLGNDLDLQDVRGRGTELRRALDVAQRLHRGSLQWSAGLARIEILGGEDYLLRVDSLPFPVLVRADLPPWKARALDDLLPQILASFEPLAAIDLRFSGRIVVKGAAQPPRAETG